MTVASDSAADKAAEKALLKERAAEIAAKELKANEGKTGKGLRTFYGMTKGRNPQMIDYENWDESKPDTLPTTFEEFMTLRKDASDEKSMVKRLILGDNDILYSEASDPTKEYVDLSWPEEIQKGFRLVVKNYSTNAGVSIEDAVALIKPGFVASQAAAAAKASVSV